ncbi:phosphotransferase, partial [Enterococcus sp. S181_ASV_20]|nr:phosphotransferase [Enterococcus sp. S181_ASV_20]
QLRRQRQMCIRDRDTILQDAAVKRDWEELIERVSSKDECLIHGDFHSSNIFVSQTSFKVIDMEYTLSLIHI